MSARKAKVACLDCRRIVYPHKAGRCQECWTQHERKRDKQRKRHRPQYGGDWRKVSKRAIRQHIMQYGYQCPHCRRADPSTNPLVTDHVHAGSRAGGLQVMCRSCNSAKGATTDKRRRQR